MSEKRRVLLRSYSVGDWYKDYDNHYFVELWGFVDMETDIITGFSICQHTPSVEMSDRARDFQNAIELFNIRMEIVAKNNKANLELIDEIKERYKNYIESEQHLSDKEKYEQQRKEFIEKYMEWEECKNASDPLGYAKHMFIYCASSKIDKVMK